MSTSPTSRPAPLAGTSPASISARRRTRRSVAATVALAAALALAAGCTGGSGSGGGGSSSVARSSDAAVGAPAAGLALDPGAPQPEPADPAGGTADSGSTTEGISTSTLTAAVAGRDVVRTAQVTVEVQDRARARTRALAAVAARGGFVADEQSDYDPQTAASTVLTLRVPVDRYSALLDDLSALGRVASLTQSSDDVSDQVVDVRSRVATQQAGVERVRALLAKADKLADVLAVESELTRREADLEALQGRLAALQDQTALSTVTLVLADQEAAVTSDDGFLAGLAAGWDAFTGATTAAVTALGAVVPFAALAVVLLVVALLVRRRLRRSPVEADPAV